ncbi:hypothetical protein BP6252_08579 [Coleophoma cylindrospora]|uniref:Uncharacterized protein n=1 Tax=Coleophoma cylindrospora TaxID=1849047 RepID=A0A3D8R688_9HELO|nr:hypothetical protein BP6252_08579 [Coleophoma cylindrospora]
MLDNLPDLQEVLDDPDLFPGRQIECLTWTIELLQELFSAAITKLGECRFTFFIDALDECDEYQIQEMVTYFQDLGQSAVEEGNSFYICLSSRHYPAIDIRNSKQLTLESQAGHGEDMAKYVRNRLRVGTGKNVEDVRAQILEKANGIFMWVVLVVGILNKEFRDGRIFAVKERLKKTPSELSDLFKDILRRDNTNMTDLLLYPDPENLKLDSEKITIDDMDRFVLNSSKGLAELTKSKISTVQFIHESVQDFLVKDDGLGELWPELKKEGDFRSISHNRLKQCCDTYMKLRQEASKTFPFIEYAARHVLYRANEAAIGLAQDDFLEEFDLTTWIKHDNIFEKFETRRHELTISFLYILTENNLGRLVETRCHYEQRIGAHEKQYQNPLFAAVSNGHEEAVRVFLDQQTDIETKDKTSRTPLSLTTQRGHEGVVKLLLEKGANAEAEDKTGKMLISWAASKGHESVVKLLLEKGANIEAENKTGQTPLSWAAQREREGMIKLLLKMGANIEAENKTGQTPLSWAAEREHEGTIKLLLKMGANIEAENKTGRTPLSWAVKQWQDDVAQLLLNNGANIEAEDETGRTPLSWAAERGREDVVKLLLEKGANIETEDKTSRTPLSWARANGHRAVINRLLKKGAYS